MTDPIAYTDLSNELRNTAQAALELRADLTHAESLQQTDPTYARHLANVQLILHHTMAAQHFAHILKRIVTAATQPPDAED